MTPSSYLGSLSSLEHLFLFGHNRTFQAQPVLSQPRFGTDQVALVSLLESSS